MATEEVQNEKPKIDIPFYCQLCNICCPCDASLQMHYLGNKHQKLLRKEFPTTETEEVKNEKQKHVTPYYCELCKVYCASEGNLQMHFKGNKHKMMLDKDYSIEDDVQSGRERNTTPFYCHLCDIYCASDINLQTHFLGNKHKRVEAVLKSHCFVKSENPSGESIKAKSIPVANKYFGQTLEDELNACKHTDPAIGLQYITEYRSKNLLYECNLCGCQNSLTSMFMHVLGAKHIMAYLERHYPDLAEVHGRGNVYTSKLKEIAAEIEKKEGRKKILTSMETPVLKESSYSIEQSDSLVTWFSEDDRGEKKKKKEDDDDDDDDDEEDEDEDAKSENSVETADETKKSAKSNNEEEKDEYSEQLVTANFSDSDSEEINSNEDVLNYLKAFEIVNEEDATFLLNVTQKLTRSLVAYRQKVFAQKKPPQLNTSLNTPQPKRGSTKKQRPAYTIQNKQKKQNIPSSNKRKSFLLNVDDGAKQHKRGSFVPTFVSGGQLSSVAEAQPNPSEGHILNPVQDYSPSQPQLDAPMTTPPGPSVSENEIIAEFFNSIRNMEYDDVAATLHMIAASNPAFIGMDVDNVLKILTASGSLKPKNSGIY